MAPTRRLVAILGILVLLLGAALGVSAQSSPAPSVSPGAPPSTVPLPTWPDALTPGDGGLAPGVLGWEAVGPPYLRDGRLLRRLTAWHGGFAALEYRDDDRGSRVPAIWHSPDGRTWTRSLLPAAIRTHGVTSILPFRGGLVIATDITPDIRGRGFDWAFWRSDDATTWHQAGTLGYRVPQDLEWRNCQANHRDLASIDGALVLYVGLCWDPCCGSAPAPDLASWAMLAPSAGTAAGTRQQGTIAWRSTDAATWQRQPLRGFHPWPRSDYGTSFAMWPDELIVLRSNGSDTLLRSSDGIRWRPFGSAPAELDTGTGLALIPSPAGVLVAGGSFAYEGDPSGPGNNLVTWVVRGETPFDPTISRQPAVVTGVIRDGATVLLIGEGSTSGPTDVDEDDEAWAWIMGTADGGLTWDPALSWTGGVGSCLREAAVHGRTVVSLGCRPWGLGSGIPTAAGTPQFWVAELP